MFARDNNGLAREARGLLESTPEAVPIESPILYALSYPFIAQIIATTSIFNSNILASPHQSYLLTTTAMLCAECSLPSPAIHQDGQHTCTHVGIISV